MEPPTWTPPLQDPPKRGRTPVFIALAVVVALPAVGATAWYLARGEAPAAAPAPTATRSFKATVIKFAPTLNEQVFLKQVKDTRRNVGWEGNDLGVLNHGRAICGLGERESDGAVKNPASKPPTTDSLLTNPPDGAEKIALGLLCPKYQLTLLKAVLGFAEGTWKVGAEQSSDTVTPGQYRTTRPPSSCTWKRIGRDGKTLAGATTSGRVTVRILKGDGGFTSKGCGNWEFIHK